VVTHLPLTQVAWVQLLDSALSSLTQVIVLFGSVKCVATSLQWVTAVEDCEYTVTLLRMTLRIGQRGFQPACARKIVALLLLNDELYNLSLRLKVIVQDHSGFYQYNRSLFLFMFASAVH